MILFEMECDEECQRSDGSHCPMYSEENGRCDWKNRSK